MSVRRFGVVAAAAFVLALVPAIGADIGVATAASPGTTLSACDETGFLAAVTVGGTVAFAQSCTILLSATIVIGVGQDVDIEGGGNTVILDGRSQIRLFDVRGG